MSLREKSILVQIWLSVILLILGIILIVTTYQDIFVPSPTLSFNLGLLSIALFGLQVLRKEGNRKKEVMLLSTVAIYINLLISGFIYKIWSFETIFTKQGITKMMMFILLVLSVYLIVAYVRAKITYKQVKGNQRHNESWRVSKTDIKRMKKSDDIYISLGIYHEGNKD